MIASGLQVHFRARRGRHPLIHHAGRPSLKQSQECTANYFSVNEPVEVRADQAPAALPSFAQPTMFETLKAAFTFPRKSGANMVSILSKSLAG
jgi:hypothetical protein